MSTLRLRKKSTKADKGKGSKSELDTKGFEKRTRLDQATILLND